MTIDYSSRGNVIRGIKVSDTKMQTALSLNQMANQLRLQRPSILDGATLRDKKSNPSLGATAVLRDEIQRRFNAPRRHRAELYYGHLERVECHGFSGGSPAITLFLSEPMIETEDGGFLVPYTCQAIAIDGETQTEARFMLAENKPETGTRPVAVTIYHGIEVSEARQILYDYNAKATPVSATETAALNSEGPITKMVNKALGAAGIPADDVNRRGAMRTRKTVVATKQILMAAAGAAKGDNALRGGISQGEMNKINTPGYDVPHCDKLVEGLCHILQKAALEEHESAVIGRAAHQVWQVAGVLIGRGRDAGSLNWTAAVEAYNSTQSAGRGGPRMSAADRLAAIASAF